MYSKNISRPTIVTKTPPPNLRKAVQRKTLPMCTSGNGHVKWTVLMVHLNDFRFKPLMSTQLWSCQSSSRLFMDFVGRNMFLLACYMFPFHFHQNCRIKGYAIATAAQKCHQPFLIFHNFCFRFCFCFLFSIFVLHFFNCFF